ncbi:MAG: YggS family pyridoxal phosphate-dependent enzyme [Oscillospiraceae bacterium]|nr:YggS family pyridoxal phosphate-dependent enzyme [Oscillospiraceae bacterium]
MSVITENVLLAKRTIAEAAAEAGRDASEVRLLAATKMNGPEAIREAVAAGVDICAENRVQEFLEKNAMNAYSGCDVHFIGHLQRNKVKYLVGAVSLIHSVDSESLLFEIDRRAAALGIVQDVLLEVNIGGEASKSGAAPEDLPELLNRAGEFSHVRVTGLMTIPPAETKPGENRNYFRRMHDLFVDIRRKKYNNVLMNELSMGMSSDYADAVRCGATIVRLGTALFGARNYDKAGGTPDGTLR